jgi:hypothetical protein
LVTLIFDQQQFSQFFIGNASLVTTQDIVLLKEYQLKSFFSKTTNLLEPMSI